MDSEIARAMTVLRQSSMRTRLQRRCNSYVGTRTRSTSERIFGIDEGKSSVESAGQTTKLSGAAKTSRVNSENCASRKGNNVKLLEKSPKECEKSPKECEKSPKVCEKSPKECEKSPKECEKSPKQCEKSPKECEKSPKECEKSPKSAIENTSSTLTPAQSDATKQECELPNEILQRRSSRLNINNNKLAQGDQSKIDEGKTTVPKKKPKKLSRAISESCLSYQSKDTEFLNKYRKSLFGRSRLSLSGKNDDNMDCKPELHEVKRLRTLLPQSYFQIVSSVLSQMLDLSGTGHGILKQIDTLINSEGKALDPGIDELSLKAIQLLLNYFETNDDALKAEGLFRKAGCVNRMKVLTKLLSSGSDGDIKECITTCSPHDISNLLKRYLSKFTDKLCGDYLYHSHIEMIDLKYNQRLTTLQLLMQLIPTLKLDLLSRFAVILHRVAASPGNLMSTSALATIVTPVVLVPEGFENELLDENAAKACSFIIENAYKLKHIPSKMVKLVLNAWVAVDGDEDTGVIVDDMSFTMRSTMFANPHYTQNKLKDLVVHVKTMPESPLKKRTLSRVNKPRDDMNFKKKIDVVKTYLKSKISLSKSNQLERTISEIDLSQPTNVGSVNNTPIGFTKKEFDKYNIEIAKETSCIKPNADKENQGPVTRSKTCRKRLTNKF